MERICHAVFIVVLFLAGSPSWASEPITPQMMEAGGGIEEFGHEVAARLASRVGTELAGLQIVDHGFHLNRPTLWYRLTFDTDAFITELIARVQRESGGQHAAAQTIMAYVLVFEREGALRTYLGCRAGEVLCGWQPERSAVDLGYHFNLIFRHLAPDTVAYQGEARAEERVVDRIGSYKHTADSCAELDLGLHDSATEVLDGAVEAMIESLVSGEARRRFEIVDRPDDAFWKQRTLGLIGRLE